MIDVHSHILPVVDDGPANDQESLKILSALSEIGFTELVLTPHLDPQNLGNKIEKIVHKFEEFKKRAAERENNLELLLGSETILDPMLFDSEPKNPLSFDISGKKYQLIEIFPLIHPSAFDIYSNYAQKHGLITILAHLERVEGILKNKRLLRKLKEKGFLFQIDIISFSSRSLSNFRDAAKRLLKEELIDLLATDCHSYEDITAIKEGLSYVRSKFSNWESFFTLERR